MARRPTSLQWRVGGAGLAVVLVSVAWPTTSSGVEPAPRTSRINVSPEGTQANKTSELYPPATTHDGRLVAFTSRASNLTPGDTNNAADVFVHDRLTGRVERVSVASSGVQGNGDSAYASFSADGRYVGFHSLASNLAAGDTNGVADVFVHDRLSGQTERVSVSSDGAQGNADSVDAQLSADGRFVAFFSAATTLADDLTSVFDVFVHDRVTRTTERVSVPAAGPVDRLVDAPFTSLGDSFSPTISADGRFVAFHSGAPNLVDGDTNGRSDVFLHDRVAFTTTRISVALDGAQANGDSAHPAMSADGRYIAYHSAANNLALVANDNNAWVDVLVYDRLTGITSRASVGSPGFAGIFGAAPNGDSWFPAINTEGNLVAFYSSATILEFGDTNGATFDVFVHDRVVGNTWAASKSTGGQWGNGQSIHPALGADLNSLVFVSEASNLVPGDTNLVDDIFLRVRVDHRALPTTTTVPLPPLPTTTSIPLPPLPTTTTSSLPAPPPGCLPPDLLDTTIADGLGCAGQPPPPIPPCAFFDPVNTSPREILDCYLP